MYINLCAIVLTDKYTFQGEMGHGAVYYTGPQIFILDGFTTRVTFIKF